MVNSLIAKIHIAKKELGLDDETYRQIIKQVSGKTSTTKCSEKQLVEIVELLKSKGWTPKTPKAKKKEFRKAPRELIAKIYALWGKLQSLGAVKSSDKSDLDKFVFKYTKVHSVQWLDDDQAVKVIEIMKQWIKRVS